MRSIIALVSVIAIVGCRTAGSDSALKDVEGQEAPVAETPAYVKERAHSTVTATSVLKLYNVTTMGAEVDALSEPDSAGGGFEYWPFVFDAVTNQHTWPYPDSIQWGYAAGGDAARKCMKLSYHVWKYVDANKPANLVKLYEIEGAPNGYFQWNNDYTKAKSEAQGFRNFWHYERPSGLLKWVSNTKMDGTCQHPTVEAVDRWAACEIKKLQGGAGQCANHQ